MLANSLAPSSDWPAQPGPPGRPARPTLRQNGTRLVSSAVWWIDILKYRSDSRMSEVSNENNLSVTIHHYLPIENYYTARLTFATVYDVIPQKRHRVSSTVTSSLWCTVLGYHSIARKCLHCCKNDQPSCGDSKISGVRTPKPLNRLTKNLARMHDYVGDDSPHAKIQNDRVVAYAWNSTLAWFLARHVIYIYISRLCYDNLYQCPSVCPSVCDGNALAHYS